MLLRFVETMISLARWLIVLGLVFCGTERAFGVAGLTGFVLMSLGVCGGCFRDWRTERL